jgi:hypothetical protein
MDRFKEGVTHALQLAGIRQFIGGLYFPFHVQKKRLGRKTMENNHHFKYS